MDSSGKSLEELEVKVGVGATFLSRRVVMIAPQSLYEALARASIGALQAPTDIAGQKAYPDMVRPWPTRTFP